MLKMLVQSYFASFVLIFILWTNSSFSASTKNGSDSELDEDALEFEFSETWGTDPDDRYLLKENNDTVEENSTTTSLPIEENSTSTSTSPSVQTNCTRPTPGENSTSPTTSKENTTTTTTTSRPPSTSAPSCKCGGGNPRYSNVSKIIGGVPSKKHAWPWMAIIISGRGNLCGGSLINNLYILTAAHCVSALSPVEMTSTVIILGRNRIYTNTSADQKQIHRIAQHGIYLHPKYNHSEYHDDIALIKLATPVSFSETIYPICLTQVGSPFVGAEAIVMGWGKTNQSTIGVSNPLRETKVNVITNDECAGAYQDLITLSTLCAYRLHHDACNGDSGGPLIVERNNTTPNNTMKTTKLSFSENVTNDDHESETSETDDPIIEEVDDIKYFTQIGIVSFGRGCAQLGSPGVYTRVEKYISWIHSKTKAASYCSEE